MTTGAPTYSGFVKFAVVPGGGGNAPTMLVVEFILKEWKTNFWAGTM